VRIVHNNVEIARGAVDLGPGLEKIASGACAFRQDGTLFKNLEVKLPRKPPACYQEWVMPTAGIVGAGPQRFVTGIGGEIYYTPDHYASFIPVTDEAVMAMFGIGR
jgi:filamentous hemagglutinin